MPAVVRSGYQSTPAVLNIPVTLAATPADDNYLIGVYRSSTNAETPVLPSGWAWATGSPYASNTTRSSGIAYKKVSGDSATVQFSSDVSSTKSLCVVEVSGLAIVASVLGPGATSVAANTLTSKNTGSTGVLPQADMYAIGLVNLSSTSGGSNAVDSGFALRNVIAGTSESFLVADLVTAATTALDPTLSWLTARNAFGQIITFKGSSADPVGSPGAAGDSLRASLNRLAGTTGMDEEGAANVWAGTTGLDLRGALNVKALTSGLDERGALNKIAGTAGLDEQDAARRIVA